jgi:hypothetical protein
MQFHNFPVKLNAKIIACSVKRIIIFFLALKIASSAFAQLPIIADHTVVDKFDELPAK